MPAIELQEVLWRHFFADTTQWWDNRGDKPTPQHPDFRHKISKVPIWLNSKHKPAWVDSQLAMLDAGMKITVESKSISLPEHRAFTKIQVHFEIDTCRKLCESGLISEAVDALDSLVERRQQAPNYLFYIALKRCVQNKDLELGKRIHALSVKGGYEGDAFLATHLIGMYASHGNLEEAMGVFIKVPKPDAHNWATIIFAYAGHGEAKKAAEAVRLYQQMCKSTEVQPDDRIYLAVLKACAIAGDLVAGKEIHAQVLTRSRKPDRFVEAALVNMYAKCGSLDDARNLLQNLPKRNIVACNAMLAGYTQQGMGKEALSLYRSMQQEGLTPPNSVTYICLLQACANEGTCALYEGKQLHAQLEERGLHVDAVLGGSLVNMYVQCGSMEDAHVVFNKLPVKDVVTWTVMIAGYAQQGMCEEALRFYRIMQQESIPYLDRVAYVCLLQACAGIGVGALNEGKDLHAQIQAQRLQVDVVIGGSLINMYVKCGSLEDAKILFNKLPERNIVAWNAMIAGYAQQAMVQEALSLFRSMRMEGLTPSSVTYVCLLQACATVGVEALYDGQQLHAMIEEEELQEDVLLRGSLVNMYAKCGSLQDARRLFDELPEKNVVTWNAMIAGYSQQGLGQEALCIFRSMQQSGVTPPNCVTYACLLQACACVGVGALDEGKLLHAQIRVRGLQDDVVVGSSLVNMYAKCGSMEDARKVFDELQNKDIVACNAMLAGYAQQRMGQEALDLYRSMKQGSLALPNSVTYICLLQALASQGLEALEDGRQLHAHIKEQGLEENVALGGSLINMYAKCGSLEDARRLFNKLPEKNVVAWNAMIAGYAQQEMGQEALDLYRSMQQEGLILPSAVTYVCLLQACAALAALPLGERLHAEIEKRDFKSDGILGAALVNMYAKCGSMYDAQRVFNSLSEKTIEAWGALVGGYARQGDRLIVFDLLDRMRYEAVHPNEIVFLSVLTVCSHAGLVDKGQQYFEAMRTDYGITASVEHYICMVDLLGRAGHLDKALQMAKTMPFPPNDVLWITLLGACWKWKNVEIGQEAFKGAVSMNHKDAAPYVLMSNIFASAGMWEAAKELQARRIKLGAWKKPGQSWWTDVNGLVHTFLVGDKKHPESKDIRARLEQLICKIKKEGYVPHLQSSLLEASDHKKEADLCGHSEKLAIAYALNKTAEGITIRIVKNLRVCEDCHTAIAYISKVEKRTILCRDTSRFHVFEKGKCSCGGYW